MKNYFLKNICLSLVFALVLAAWPYPVIATEANEAEEVKAGSLNFFEARLSEPARENAYFYSDNRYYQGGYGLPNCTAYAWGRAFEILQVAPDLPMGNAQDWWGKNMASKSYPYGSSPKLGAIICFGAGSSGHVAVVEKIQGDQVTYSESAWSGPVFTAGTYTMGTEETVSVGGFQGYIYIGDFVDVETDKTPPRLSDLSISEVDQEGFTIRVKVEDGESGIDKVFFPVWTTKDGQDDLIWHAAEIKENQATYRLLYQDHKNEQLDYIIHAYAYDKAGLSSRLKKTTAIDALIIEKKISL